MTLNIHYLRSRASLPYYLLSAMRDLRHQLEDRDDIDFGELTEAVNEHLNEQHFIVRNLRCTGKDIPRDILPKENAIVIHSLHGKTVYVRVSLE